MFAEVATLSGHNERVWHCAWNPKGDVLASCGTDKAIRLWREGNGRWEQAESLSTEHRRTVRSVAWSPCGRYLASTSFDSTIVIWELADGEWKTAGTLEGHENEALPHPSSSFSHSNHLEVKRAAWAPSGRFLATASRDKSVWLWEVDEDDEFSCCSILQNHSQDVKHVAWHPKTDILFSCSYDNSFRSYAFDGDDWVEIFAAENAHESTIWALALSADGRQLITAAQDATMKVPHSSYA